MLVYNGVALLNNGGRHRDVILCSAWNIVSDLPFAKKAAAGRCGSLFAAEKRRIFWLFNYREIIFG